jgi:LPXTG-motif cell wall-anchored protein
MKKRYLAVLGGMVASVALVGSALPAQAFTPTISEVRYLPGPAEADWGDSWYDLALTPDASTAVFSTDSATFIVDVAANTATEIPGVSGGTYFLLDASGSYLYVLENNDIFKVDMTSKTIVATWNDAAYDLAFDYMYFSADQSSIFVLGRVGSFPNFAAAVAKVNLTTGAITQYESTDTGTLIRRAGYDSTSGLMYIPTVSADGLVGSMTVFDTAANTFTELPWTDSGIPMDCDSQSGVLACVVDDTNFYVAKIDAAGAVVSSVDVDSAVSDADSVTLTPDGTRAYVYGADGGLNNVEVIDMTTMTSVIVLNLLTDYQNVVRMAADAGQIWFTADYIRDYDGGYQVASFDAGGSNPQLPDTGLDAPTLTVTGVAIGAAGLLLLGFYVVRRRSVSHAK